MFQVKFHHSEMYTMMEYTIPYMGNTVDFLPYNGRDRMEIEKNGKTWRNEVKITVKIATSEIHFSIFNIEKEFHHTEKYIYNILYCIYNFLRGKTYQKIIFYGRIPLSHKLLRYL